MMGISDSIIFSSSRLSWLIISSRVGSIISSIGESVVRGSSVSDIF